MSERRRFYRAWMWKRLAFVLPAGVAALAAGAWFLVRPSPSALRVPCVLLAATVAALQCYLAVRTVAVASERKGLPLQVARTRRQELRPAFLVSLLSVASLVVLGIIPVPFPVSTAPQDPGAVARWRPRTKPAAEPTEAAPTPPLTPEIPVTVDLPPSPVAASAPSPVAVPAPEPVAARPEIRPELALEPAHLTFEEMEPPVSRPEPSPLESPRPAAPVAQDPALPEDDGSPFRSDREQFGNFLPRSGWLIGLQYRPLPDERDTEGLPPIEARVDGFVLLGGGDRVPGLMLSLEVPLSPHDLLQASWMAADLPHVEDVDRRLSADWHHTTIAYVRRIQGYTSRATFDLSLSVGASVDFLGDVVGIPDPGGTPKFSPYAGVDMGFWQQTAAVGLLLHLGESFPWTILGSSLGMTDFSAQIRWDLTERVSIHGGYRVVLLHYKLDAPSASPGADPLRESLSGPMLGLDVRF